ncbi:uncharacterized protein SOCEGT47_043330 [Sorangium cellulosum]|uniref:DUF1440 domain-containing protein n=1 Tax=Sorangium cellulosum TaxID=56 RepID=A0A4P2Q4F2_SORCE|nr:hypothetical protein [Sorangium cellulosum]AUX23803.1 uncharacterized protein SOCEGT47_043330 [Sorangium cellulosum]
MKHDAIVHAAGGVLGGTVGTALMLKGMKASQKLPERLKPPPVRRDPGEFMVSRVEQLRGAPLRRGLHDALARGMHWGYGATSGALFGLATSRLRLRTLPAALLAGSVMGTAVWAVGYIGWLPAAKLTPPVWRQGARRVAVSVLGHMAFGIVSAIPVLLLDRRRAEPWWRRALKRIAR